jgi:hypothetical protein
MRAIVFALAAFAVACSPPAAKQEDAPGTAVSEPGAATADAPNPERDAMTAALAPRVEAEIGRPVSFSVTTMRVTGDWGWLIAQPWTPEGAQIDWSQTRYAERAEGGFLDGGGTTYALLRREGERWRVVDFAVGPTDVAWADWATRHGAPESLFVTNFDLQPPQ